MQQPHHQMFEASIKLQHTTHKHTHLHQKMLRCQPLDGWATKHIMCMLDSVRVFHLAFVLTLVACHCSGSFRLIFALIIPLLHSFAYNFFFQRHRTETGSFVAYFLFLIHGVLCSFCHLSFIWRSHFHSHFSFFSCQANAPFSVYCLPYIQSWLGLCVCFLYECVRIGMVG